MSSLVKKFLGTAGLQLVSKGLMVISGVVFARYLGAEQFGLYSFALSIVTLATLPVIAGLPNLLVREIANHQLEKNWGLLTGVISWSRWYVFILSILIISCMYIGLNLDFFENSVTSLLWMAVWLIPLRGLLTQKSAVLNGFRQPVLAQLPAQLLVPLVTLCVLSYYLLFDIEWNSRTLVGISILASFIALLLSGFLLSNTMKLHSKKLKSIYTIKNWHRSLIPFTLITFISTLNTELASVLLGWLVSYESVAHFKVAMQAVALISLGLSSINAVIMPNVARYYKQGDLIKTQEILTKSVRLSTFVSLPIILILVFFGEYLIRALFGNEYLPAYPILVILCIGQLVNVLMGSVGLVLKMTNNENKVLKSMLLTLILTVLLLVLLIPFYGNIGAAIAVSIGLVCWNIIMAIDVYKLTKLMPWIK
ncbi:flippase [Paraglaciecola arctica]|uniref:flippase n=1 Tax=Paraglaciecola arctica TaxID=1128911 RepID=UPI001C07BEB4|nr:flippase [Paraglaciecola arctica]MBU3004205.1 flippase [Paraglaciecola arctica]